MNECLTVILKSDYDNFVMTSSHKIVMLSTVFSFHISHVQVYTVFMTLFVYVFTCIDMYRNVELHAWYLYILQPSRCANQIEEVCKDIEKTINQTIQNTLNALEKDCDSITSLIDKTIEQDK